VLPGRIRSAGPTTPTWRRRASFSFAPDTPGGNVFTGSVSQGNPDLKPYESMNFDLSAERYLKNSGLVSVGVFHKRIDNPVFSRAYTLRNTTYEGMPSRRSASAARTTPTAARSPASRPTTSSSSPCCRRPFNGLGFGVNVTLADSEERLFSRPTEKLRFAKQADTLYNVVAVLREIRLRGAHRLHLHGRLPASFGASVASDSYQAKRLIIDAKISYRLTKHFRLFADVINLGEEPLNEYAGYPQRMSATEIYWWTANFGVNWRL
jgi:outer membrane receptor protein involved in Fe transport